MSDETFTSGRNSYKLTVCRRQIEKSPLAQIEMSLSGFGWGVLGRSAATA
jgi:hypothetical protein